MKSFDFVGSALMNSELLFWFGEKTCLTQHAVGYPPLMRKASAKTVANCTNDGDVHSHERSAFVSGACETLSYSYTDNQLEVFNQRQLLIFFRCQGPKGQWGNGSLCDSKFNERTNT